MLCGYPARPFAAGWAGHHPKRGASLRWRPPGDRGRRGGAPALAIHRVADTDTTVPGHAGAFNGFGALRPALDQGVVAFRGTGPTSEDGIYIAVDGALSRVADTSKPVPGAAATLPETPGFTWTCKARSPGWPPRAIRSRADRARPPPSMR
jgi:hypothetical protein